MIMIRKVALIKYFEIISHILVITQILMKYNMLRLLVVSNFFVCTLGAAMPSDLMPQLDGRIVGSVPTTISSFPWQVSIQRSGSHSCGGSIYSNTIIVTAAHCLQSISPSQIKIRAGSSYWNSGGVLLSVQAFKNHEKYNPITMVNDVAIIRLSSPLTYGSTIKNISLATTDPANGASATVSGWGTLKSGGGSVPLQLQKVELAIVRRTECASSIYGYGNVIRSTMLCAISTGRDACQGDSGGPLVSNGVLVGIVSWGEGCAFENFPGVYADVADLNSWVVQAVKELETS